MWVEVGEHPDWPAVSANDSEDTVFTGATWSFMMVSCIGADEHLGWVKTG